MLIKTLVHRCQSKNKSTSRERVAVFLYQIKPNTSFLLCSCTPVRSCCSYFNSFYLIDKDSFCRKVFNFIVQRLAMENADFINSMVSTVPTYESNTSGTQNNRAKHFSVKDVSLNKRLSYAAGNLFSKMSPYGLVKLKAFLRIPHILWIV